MSAFGITHIKTGMLLTRSQDPHLARYIDKHVRWTWLDSLDFGVIPSGRGRTMALKALRQAEEDFLSLSPKDT